MKAQDSYTVIPFPKLRRFSIDNGAVARDKNIVHGLLEVDVTKARQYLREHKARTGESLSFTAFILVTSVGMFGKGGAWWGIPNANFALTVTLGGIAEKPGVVDGSIEIREYLCLTLSFDHAIVDGAPAARFGQQFKELIECGYGLNDHNV